MDSFLYVDYSFPPLPVIPVHVNQLHYGFDIELMIETTMSHEEVIIVAIRWVN